MTRGERRTRRSIVVRCSLLIVCLLFAQQVRSQQNVAFEAAKRSLARGDFAGAEARFRQLLKQNPNSPELNADLGIALHEQGRFFEAIDVLQKSLSFSRQWSTTAFLALDLCQTQQYLKAQPLLDDLEGKVKDRSMLHALGPCFLAANRPLGAIGVYDELGKAASDDGERQEASAGLIRACFDAAHQLVAILPTLPNSATYVGAIEAAATGGADAKSAYADATAAEPALAGANTPEDLVRLYREKTTSAATVYVLATAVAEKAAEAYAQFQERWPGSMEGYRLTAEMYAARGGTKDLTTAAENYEQLLAAYPNAPGYVHFALGNMYESLGRQGAALDQFKAAYDPSHPDVAVLERLTAALLRTGDYGEVTKLLMPFQKAKQGPGWIFREYGRAQLRKGNLAEAVPALERAVANEPDDAAAHYALYQAYRATGNQTSAAAEISKFRQLRKEN